MALRAWNMIGSLDWNGILPVAEMLGIADIEMLIHQLVAIRDFVDSPEDAINELIQQEAAS